MGLSQSIGCGDDVKNIEGVEKSKEGFLITGTADGVNELQIAIDSLKECTGSFEIIFLAINSVVDNSILSDLITEQYRAEAQNFLAKELGIDYSSLKDFASDPDFKEDTFNITDVSSKLPPAGEDSKGNDDLLELKPQINLVSKGGNSDHQDIIRTCQVQLMKDLEIDLESLPINEKAEIRDKFILERKRTVIEFSDEEEESEILRGALSEERYKELLLTHPNLADQAAITQAYVESHTITKDERVSLAFSDNLLQYEYFNNHVKEKILEKDVFKNALFKVLIVQLGEKLSEEKHEIYKLALNKYLEKKIDSWIEDKDEPFIFSAKNIYEISYAWVLDFKEEIDLAESDEVDGNEKFESFRMTAQGPFSSTCGFYAVLSFLENCGVKSGLEDKTYSELDSETFKLLVKYGSNEPTMNLNAKSFRAQGVGMDDLAKASNDINKDNELKFIYHEKIDANTDIRALHQNNPKGFVTAISTNVGPHAVHVISIQGSKVSYYDPIGKDGRDNTQHASIGEFDDMWIKDWGYINVSDTEE